MASLMSGKKKFKAIAIHKGILKYLTKQVDIPTEEEAENYEYKMKIYEVNAKACNFLIISLTEIPFGMVRQCDENTHDIWEELIDKYYLSYKKQESLNKLTSRWNNCKIKDISLDPEIWFNALYNLNLKFKNIKEKYEKDEYELKAYVFDVLHEE